MHRTASLSWLAGLIIVVAVIAAGCGSGGGDGQAPPPGTGTATLNGQVVAADNTGTVIPSAVVTVEGTGKSATTGTDGGFVITGLPSGERLVTVTTPQSADYGTASARVPLVSNQTRTVSFAVLPLGLPAPQQILVDPASATLDINGRIAYRAQVLGGQIGRGGLHGAQCRQWQGQGVLRECRAHGDGVCRGAAPAPGVELPGESAVSACHRRRDLHLCRDQGWRRCQPRRCDRTHIPGGSGPGRGGHARHDRSPNDPTSFLEASFGATYQVPPNANAPSADGVQAPESYSVNIRVEDQSGMTAESDFVDITVQGIDAPPVRPGV